jgi:RNA polymerase sigma factor (sigma-70 family)
MSATISEAAVSSEAGARSDNTDRQLLDRFVAHGDPGAFAELVARHGACVWAVCWRALGQEQDAEDAFQAVFLILARRAGAIRKQESVGSWLHSVAFHTATKVRRAAARRQTREQHAGSAAPEPPHPDQAAARELQRLLDEEVARLAKKYRTPFVLCCLEGLTRVEAAQELGWSEGTVSSRLAQARAQLKARLAQRGFTLSAVLTACALAEGPASAAIPVALAEAAVQAGVAGDAVTAFSAAVAALADGIQRALLITKLKSAVVALMLIFVASAVGFAAYQMYPPPEENAPVVQEKPAAPPPVVAAAPGKPNDVWTAVISRDGKLAAGGAGWWDQPGEIAVWEMDTQKRLMHAVEAKGVGCVAFSPDDQYLASASWSGHVRLRAAPAWKEVANLKLPGASRGIAFSPDGSLLAVATERKTVHVIDVAERKILYELGGDLMRFHCVAFSPDGKRLLAGGGEWEQKGPCQVTIWTWKASSTWANWLGTNSPSFAWPFRPMARPSRPARWTRPSDSGTPIPARKSKSCEPRCREYLPPSGSARPPTHIPTGSRASNFLRTAKRSSAARATAPYASGT